MSRRVVVTGMGAVTPIGIGVKEFWDGIRAGKKGFAPITSFDASEYKCKLAAEVKGFEAEKYMDRKAARRMELFCQYAVAAAKEALADAGLDMEKEDPYRVGCFVGSGIGSLQAMDPTPSSPMPSARLKCRAEAPSWSTTPPCSHRSPTSMLAAT